MKDNIAWSIIGLAKFLFAGLVTLVFRLLTPFVVLPFFGSLSNVTPLMATELAGGRAYNPLIGGLYGAAGMFALDMITDKVSMLSFWTSGCYFIVGFVGAWWLRKRPEIRRRDFVIASIWGTLFFDLVTGVLIAPFGSHPTPLAEAAVGQILFTAKGLIGNVFFACFAPWFHRRIMTNLKLEALFCFGIPHA